MMLALCNQRARFLLVTERAGHAWEASEIVCKVQYMKVIKVGCH